jgi:ABC-type transporter Mla MlaB component
MTTRRRPRSLELAGPSGPAAPRPPPTVVYLSGRIEPEELPDLCERAAALLERCGLGAVVCDVGELDAPDAVTLDALARLQLAARRLGRRVRFRNACGELEALLALTGLGEVLPCGPRSGVEPRRQAEEREHALRVQEERDPGDPPA